MHELKARNILGLFAGLLPKWNGDSIPGAVPVSRAPLPVSASSRGLPWRRR